MLSDSVVSDTFVSSDHSRFLAVSRLVAGADAKNRALVGHHLQKRPGR
jgi:hypothetical protein